MNESVIIINADSARSGSLITLNGSNHQTLVEKKQQTVTVLDFAHRGQKGDKGEPGLPGPSGAVSFQYPAQTALGGHRIVMLNNLGKVEYAFNDDVAHLDRIIGMTTGAASLNAVANVLNIGELSEPSWDWLLNLPIYLGVNGLMTQVEPVFPGSIFSVIVGFPITANTIFINIGFPIILN